MLVTPENYASYTGFLWVLDEMMKNEDFRYEHCASAGTLKDFASLQRITFMTTEDSSTPDAHRKTMYSSTYMINPVQLKADVLLSLGEYPGALYPDAPLPSWMIKPTAASVNDPAWNRYALRTGFLGANMVTGPGISGVAGYFSATGAEEVRVHWPLYRNQQRPILRGSDVYHILPPPDGTHWDGVQYFNPKLNKGSVLLFRPGTAAAGLTVSFKLKRLVRGATYTLGFQDDPSQNTTKTGAELMDSGITVGSSVGGNFASEIIWIN